MSHPSLTILRTKFSMVGRLIRLIRGGLCHPPHTFSLLPFEPPFEEGGTLARRPDHSGSFCSPSMVNFPLTTAEVAVGCPPPRLS